MNSFIQFKQLHEKAKPLLIGNVWNPASARLFEKLQFQAIGTSSAALADSLGYDDGQQLPFQDLLYQVARIKRSSTLPLTVDIENGYAEKPDDVLDNLLRLHDLGIVGVNLEDSKFVNGKRQMVDGRQFADLLHAIIAGLSRRQSFLFFNIRTDGFLQHCPNAMEDTIERIVCYEQAGAHGIFVPGIVDTADIKNIVEHTPLPLNVMCMPNLPTFSELEKAGVKRISMGNFFYNHLNDYMEMAMKKIQDEQHFNSLF